MIPNNFQNFLFLLARIIDGGLLGGEQNSTGHSDAYAWGSTKSMGTNLQESLESISMVTTTDPKKLTKDFSP